MTTTLPAPQTILPELMDWVLSEGVIGTPPSQIIEGLCERLQAHGLALHTMRVAHRTLHPQYGASAIEWSRDQASATMFCYGNDWTLDDLWQKSPFYHLLKTGQRTIHRRLVPFDTTQKTFAVFDELRATGATDYFGVLVPFSALDKTATNSGHPIRGATVAWTSAAPDGFSTAETALLAGIIPALAMVLKAVSNRQMAVDVARTYLGQNAGERVLSGEIQRGSVETRHAVICYFDLQNFTLIAENNPGPMVVAMLNDYFGLAVDIIEARGGNVLKFMGDGMLAGFDVDVDPGFPRAAVEGAVELRTAMHDLNARRAADGLPVAGFGLALHAGDVLYGNIGGADRLDFTVIGPAVNAAARIQGLCRNLAEDVLVSVRIADYLDDASEFLVPIGPYKLRGIREPLALFALR